MRSDVHRAPYGSGLGEIRGLIFLRGVQMKFASMEDPFPRGTFMGKQVTGPRLSEAEHFRKCPLSAVAMST